MCKFYDSVNWCRANELYVMLSHVLSDPGAFGFDDRLGSRTLTMRFFKEYEDVKKTQKKKPFVL